ncbi:MAG: NAD(P)-dependent oxidoreductase [Kiloniellales bacterium]
MAKRKPAAATPRTIGFIGLGQMGWPMAARLARAGFRLRLHDRDQARLDGFAAAHGGQPTRGPAEAAERAEVLITMLPDGAAVRQVVLDGPAPAAAGLAAGSLVVDMGSSAPAGTRALGAALTTRGVGMLDAPVSGGVKRAEAGRLTIMVGGEAPAIAWLKPLFEALAERVFETGRLGSGHAMKAINNLISAAGLVAAAEGLIIGARFGLDPEAMVDVLNASTGRNNATENKVRQFILSRRFDSGFALELMVKDIATALDLARATGTPAPLGEACQALWTTAQERLDQGVDHTAVVRHLEGLAGSELKSGAIEGGT